MKANYHTHTFRCGHAKGTEREYVESAVKKGLGILGFADHTYYPGLYDHYDLPGMKRMQFEEYASTVLALKQEYAGEIEIYLGVEAEYYPDYFEGLKEMLRASGVEYMILGQHYLENRIGTPLVKNVSDDPNLLKRYCEQTIEGIRTGCFSYVAHPDLVQDMSDNALYEETMRGLCKAAKEQGIPLEINLAGIKSKIHYPNENFWKIAGEEKCQVILGADAHNPDFVFPEEEYHKAMDLVSRYNLDLVDTLKLVRF